MTRRLHSGSSLVALSSLLLLTLLAGCASGGGGDVTAPAAAEPPMPAKKPFVAPDFEATEWKSEELGFSVHYPSDFAEQPPNPGGLFTAASPAQVPRIDVLASPSPPDTSIDGVAAGVESALSALGGGEASVTNKKEVKLQDGVTDAMELVVEWTFQGFPLQSLVLGTVTGDQLVNVMVTGMQGGDMAELSEIAYTLYFY